MNGSGVSAHQARHTVNGVEVFHYPLLSRTSQVAYRFQDLVEVIRATLIIANTLDSNEPYFNGSVIPIPARECWVIAQPDGIRIGRGTGATG